MNQFETEVKFYLADPAAIRQRIVELGAESRGRLFESNIRFEDAGRTLQQSRSLLRLRRDRKVKLTYKSTPPQENSQFKIMKELEVEVDDFDTMHLILEAVGFHREQVYEKWCETLTLSQTEFCLDSMPYGEFLEIEGKQREIVDYAAQLGLKWDQRILSNYLHIFEIIREKLKLNFSDLTFDNFENIDVDLADYLHLLVAKD